MPPAIQTALGVAATIVLAVLDELLPDGGMTLLAVVAVLAIASVIQGERLPLFLRVVTTGTTFYFGYVMCLVGRTMEPGFTPYTVWMSLVTFGLFGAAPTLLLLHIWRGRLGVVIAASVIPLCFAAAFAVAAYEEHRFIQDHRQGVGPTARWTVPHHWLAYDAQAKHLSGSD